MDTSLRLAADPAAWAVLATLITVATLICDGGLLNLDNLAFIVLLSDRKA